jgi:lipopolysaccharide transport system permease protein
MTAPSKLDSPAPPRVIVDADQRAFSLGLREIRAYWQLLFFLGGRDVVLRYKQTALGVLWAIIQPLTATIIFSVFFGGFINVPSDGVPYPAFSSAGLLPWGFFAAALQAASQSLVNNQTLITKVYFPRLIVPLASGMPAALDFAINFVVFLVLTLLVFRIPPSANVIWLPAFLLLAGVTALGVGLWISALNVQYRDFRFIVPFLVQIWMFASPVTYPASVVPEIYRPIYSLNPMVGVIEGFRWALLGAGTPPGLPMLISAGVALALLVSGLIYFRKTESLFADVI